MVIVGSGFGGLFAARALFSAPVEVTVIDRVNHHLFQPLLYQVATGILSEGEVAPTTRDILRRHRNVDVLLAEVTGIDLDRRVVHSSQPGRTLETSYDSLIVATGMETSYFGNDGLSRFAPGMKSIDDALEVRGRIFDAFEMAETETDRSVRRSWLTFLVVGGGPSGVEMAGQIVELSRRALRGNFRNIDPATAHVILAEGTEKLLAAFGGRAPKIALHDLRALGVDVRTDCMVVGMDDEGADLRYRDGREERVEARTKIWAAGTRATPLGRQLTDASGAELDRSGRVRVLPDCTLPGHPEVFVVGDIMALHDLPGLAEVAIQSGVHAALTVRRRLSGETTARPFRYRDLGTMAVISRFRAVAIFGRISVGGFPGWLLWLIVHLTFLTGFKNRFTALIHWAIAFVGRGGAERVITRQQIVAREAIATAHATATAHAGPATTSPAHEEVPGPKAG